MNTVEQEQLINTINDLVSKANGWDRIVEYFENDSEIKPILEEVQRKCWDDQICGAASIYIATIEELLKRIDYDE